MNARLKNSGYGIKRLVEFALIERIEPLAIDHEQGLIYTLLRTNSSVSSSSVEAAATFDVFALF